MKNVQAFGYEKRIGKTPSGGASCEIYYYCGYNEICAKEDATYCVIFEKSKKGETINEIHCKL